MTDFEALRAAVIKGKRNDVAAIVQAAIDGGEDINLILDRGMIPAMREIGDKFSRNEAYVPELLIAARAMQAGLALLEPLIAASGRKSMGKVAIGTVKGDLHDIGKNLVRMMLEGKGLTVIDLGVDVPPEKFIESAIENDCKIICCSALLTTTMPVMGEVVEKAVEAGVRDKVKIMIGGAPVTEAFGQSINADAYTPDATTCAEVAMQLLAS